MIKHQPTIGILGGSSHVITGSYYQLLNAELRAILGGQHVAETLIRGMNFGNVAEFATRGDWNGLRDYVAKAVDDLEAGGADLIIGTSNTVHEVMDEVMEGRRTAFLPISKPLIDAVKASRLERIAMIGTKSTMANGKVMRELTEATGAQIIVPDADGQEEVHRVIFEELCQHEFLPTSRDRFAAIARGLAEDEGAQGLILGCTEIMLLIGQDDLPELKVFPTGKLHIEAAAALVEQELARQEG